MTAEIEKAPALLIEERAIIEKVKSLGEKISAEYKGSKLLLVSILKGSFIFMADLCRAVSIPLEIDFIRVESYDGERSSGNVRLIMDLKRDISEYNVLVIEDIIDTGRTLNKLVEILKEKNPLSLKVFALLDKPEARVVDFKPDESLFIIPDVFVVGYGLDSGERFRNLPYIAKID